MSSLRSISKSLPKILLFTAIAAFFFFAACSGQSQKKKNTSTESTTTTKNTRPQSSQTTTKEDTEQASKDTTKTEAITAKRGKKIAKSNGCFSCHTTDGTEKAAPTFKNLYGRKTTLKNGLAVTADSAYLAQSIKDPNAKIVKGFSPLMPPFNYLEDDQIASIIAYIKSISE